MRPVVEDAAFELELTAELQLQHFRGLRLASLRGVALASLPAWVQIHLSILPDLVAWLAFLAQGFCVLSVIAYGALERRWSRRARQVEPVSGSAWVHALWTDWDELRSALWYGLALACLVPWLYVGMDRGLDASSRAGLTATAWTMLLLVAVVEVLRGVRRPGRRPPWLVDHAAPLPPRMDRPGRVR